MATKSPNPKSEANLKATPPVTLAVIRIRGRNELGKQALDTFKVLNLKRINNCVILEDTKQNMGMVRKVQSYITWGQIDPDTLKLLNEKRGDNNSKIFRLSPPRKGHRRGGVRKPYSEGGALGNRNEKINDLIRKML